MNEADGGGEAQLDGTGAEGERVLRIVNAAADDGVDVHVKFGVLREQLQLLVEHLEALLRDIVGHHVVDGDLHVVKAGVVEALDALGDQQIAVGDHAGDGAVGADAANDVVELRVKQRLAATNSNDGRPQAAELV